MTDKINLEIEISLNEWKQAEKSVPLLSSDLSSPEANFCIFSDGIFRYWQAGYGQNGILLSTDRDSRSYKFLLSREAVEKGMELASSKGSCIINLQNDGVLYLSGDSEPLQLFSKSADYSPEIFQTFSGDNVRTFSVRCNDLNSVIKSVCAHLYLAQVTEGARAELFVYDDCLEVRSQYRSRDFLSGTIPILTRDEPNHLITVVDSFVLMRVLHLFRSDEEILMTIRTAGSDPMLISGGNIRARIATYRSIAENSIDHAKDVIKKACGVLALSSDQDGDLNLVGFEHGVYGRFEFEKREPILLVFAVLLSNVECSSELLREINSLNTNINFARVFWVDNQVLVELDLVARSLDVSELRAAIDRIITISDDIAPIFTSFLNK